MATVDELETRVRAVEEEAGGEKLVTRHILTETRRNSDDLAKILAQISHMQGDIVLGNAALRTHGTRLDSLTRDVTLLRNDVTALRRGQEELHVRLDQLQADMGARFERVDARFTQVDTRFAQVDTRFDQMQGRFDQLQASVAAILAAVAPRTPPAV